MSTNAAVRSAWQTNVFDNISGPNAYNYLIDPDSGADVDKGYASGTINFFTYVVTASEIADQLCGKNRLEFTVTITRFIQDDVSGANHNTLIDDFREIADNVNDNLTDNWAATVDTTTQYPDPADMTPEIATWDGKPCWTATVVYKAEKIVNN